LPSYTYTVVAFDGEIETFNGLDSAKEAAERYAEKNEMPGMFNVFQGEPIAVLVEKRTVYKAVSTCIQVKKIKSLEEVVKDA
jgi:hypothetical protein